MIRAGNPFGLNGLKGTATLRATESEVQTPREVGGTLIFSHIRRLGLFFGVQNSEFQFFFLYFQKNEYFLGGMIILWIFFGGHHKIGLV